MKVKKTKNHVLGKLWRDLVFSVIGEQFGDKNLVGIMLAVRKSNDIISVWMGDDNHESRFKIGEKLKKVMRLEVGTVLDYKRHQQSMKDGSTYKNSKSFVFARK